MYDKKYPELNKHKTNIRAQNRKVRGKLAIVSQILQRHNPGEGRFDQVLVANGS